MNHFDVWTFVAFFVLSIPLVWQDLQTHSVSTGFLFLAYLIWLMLPVLSGDGLTSLWWAILVLTIGAASLLVFPGRFGEADVIYMSAMASLLGFWPSLVAMALASTGGLLSYVWMSRLSSDTNFAVPIPFLPCLFWGGIGVFLGEWLR